jgi:hypothetical protein
VLVHLAGQQRLELVRRGIAVPARDPPLLGDGDADEDVALAVVARSRLEEAPQVRRPLRVGEPGEVVGDRQR